MATYLKEQIDGPDVIHFIADNQANPQLLEDLAARVMQIETEWAIHLNVPACSTTHLCPEMAAVPDSEEKVKGYRLTINVFKESDPKDITGWKTQQWFLSVMDDDSIIGIYELAEVDMSPVALALHELGHEAAQAKRVALNPNRTDAPDDDSGPFSSGAKVGGFW